MKVAQIGDHLELIQHLQLLILHMMGKISDTGKMVFYKEPSPGQLDLHCISIVPSGPEMLN